MKSTRAKKIVQANTEAGVSREETSTTRAASQRVPAPPLRHAQRLFLAEFGAQVKGLRLLRGWTLKQLAERASLREYYVGAVEKGSRDLGAGAACRIAAALEIPIRDLLGAPSTTLSKNGKAMARFAERGDPEIAALVVRLLKLIHDEMARHACAAQPDAPSAKTRRRKAGT